MTPKRHRLVIGFLMAHGRSIALAMLMVAFMLDREVIATILRAELDRAILCQEQRAMEYQLILHQLNHESSCPHDADRVEEAYLAEMAARDAAWKALERFTAFDQFGVIPTELPLEPAKARSAGN